MPFSDDIVLVEPICDKWFQHFIERRLALIRAYERGDLNKKEFLQSNLKDIDNSNVRPFFLVDRLEKGIFNYQYYNALAKHYRMEARKVKNRRRNRRDYTHYLSLSEKYYGKKDETILDILKFMNFNDLYGYFIHCRNKNLEDELFEIVFVNYPEFILHSKSKQIYETLCDHNVFHEDKKRSIIDNYTTDSY